MTRIDDDYQDLYRAAEQQQSKKRQETTAKESRAQFQHMLETKQKLTADQQKQEQQKREQQETSFKTLSSMRDKVRQHEMKEMAKANERWKQAQHAAFEKYADPEEDSLRSKEDRVLYKEESLAQKDLSKDVVLEVEKYDERQQGQGGGSSGEQKDREEEHKQRHAEGGLIEGVRGLSPFAAVASADMAAQGGLSPEVVLLLESIVQAVHSGFDVKGLGVIQIDLKDTVLSGARLLLRADGRGGLMLKITTEHTNTKRLLSSGSTAKELSRALSKKGLRLESFEVNNDKIIG
jgi:hypothetical protein